MFRMSTVGARIRNLRESRMPKVSQAKFADLLGAPYTRAVVTNWENGRTSPDEDALRAIASKFPVTVDWLYGEGPPLSRQMKPSDRGLRPLSKIFGELFRVPIVGSASAGAGAFNIDAENGYAWVPKRLADLGTQGYIVDGDSMMPHIEHGDLAIILEHHEPRRGVPMLIKDSEGVYRLKQLEWEGGVWVMHSMNPAYESAPMVNCEILGYLVGLYRVQGDDETLRANPNGLRF